MTAATLEARDARAADIGVWLFLASVVMFYGALFSGYVLLRAGSATWETPWRAGAAGPWPAVVDHALRTAWLGFAVVQSRRVSRIGTGVPGSPRFAWLVVAAGAMFVWRCAVVARGLAAAGHTPASSVPLACWFVLTGAVAVLVAGGAIAAAWIALEAAPPTQRARRGTLLARYWLVVLGIWFVTVLGLYV
jgi:heme/copper-type cytochrome/quinol oxidase subunit 3